MVDNDDIPIMHSFPTYGDLLTLENFKEICSEGMFIDYDGFGYLATATKMSDIIIRPSFLKKMVIPNWATHVIWFNK